ncbi:hypothetical protein ACHAPT_012884 [Fusarium lateritium]
MSWDRYELGQKNIFYDEDIRLFPGTVLPPHVERVRRSMMDFSCAIRGHTDSVMFFIEGQPRLQNDGLDQDPAFQAAQKALYKATSIVKGGYLEKKWENFFETHFFEALGDGLAISKHDSRRVSRCNYYYDGLKRETNELWDLFKGDGSPGFGSFGFERLKCPKPDQAFYLPIYHFDSKYGIPTIIDPEARQWNRAPDTSIMDTFSWSTLKKLHEFGLQPTPVRIFQKQPMEANLKCYPWLIVEHKKEDEAGGRPARVVSCQAANAAACAVSLVRESAKYAVELPDQAQIPPIPAVTNIGSRVTLWVMYFAKNFEAPCSSRVTEEVTTKRRNQGYIMRAVWNGDMTKIVDIVKFQMILENTHTWAMRAFKPLMSSYIDQWKHVHCQPNVDWKTAGELLKEAEARRRQTIERRREVLPIVQALLNDDTDMEIDSTAHRKVTPLLLGLLMHQICSSERELISKEVDRVVTDKLDALNLTGQTSIAPHQQHNATQVSLERESEQASPTFRSSPITQEPPIDNEDPNDSDYRPTQATSVAGDGDVGAAASEASNASVAPSSEHEFSDQVTPLWRPTRDHVTPSTTSPRDKVPGRPGLHSREWAPLSGSTVTGSAETTPTANSHKDRASSHSPRRSLGSPWRSQHLGESSNRVPFRSPSGSPVFADQPPPERRRWSPGRIFTQLESPEPPGTQQSSGDSSGPQLNDGTTHPYIDLTRDTQEPS